ncbi:MAG TPA: hypothetical protein VMV68_02805 [Spirochaetia bacterium]|nr:hypothetical protein [Spirochaetia bacterium]
MRIARRFRIPLFVLVIIVGYVLFNGLLSITLYNPAFAVPVFGWAEAHSFYRPLISLRERLSRRPRADYPLISIAELQSLSDDLPRAAVVGTVTTMVYNEQDGDWHINVRGRHGRTQVLEIVPEYPLSLPTIGELIEVWGIVRYDVAHRWWELHPVFGWKPAATGAPSGVPRGKDDR